MRWPILLMIAALNHVAYAHADSDLVSIGKNLYQRGINAEGKPISGLVYRDVSMQGDALACIKCHRRSGYGSSESRIVVPAITGQILFSQQNIGFTRDYRHGRLSNTQRPAYTQATLARALRHGIDVSGRSLSSVMPRYDLDDREVKALAAYLNTLEISAAPGVNDTEIHFATIIAPGTPVFEQRALLDILEKYLQRKNTETRQETERAISPPFQRAWSFNAYRKWVLHVWRLEGGPEQWQSQLERNYQQQPVFAVVSGIGNRQWQPVHDFCESQQIPCLLPHLSTTPVVSPNDFYSLYISRGLMLEAQAIASDINNRAPVKIVQLRHSGSGDEPAHALRQALAAQLDITLVDVIIEEQMQADSTHWTQTFDRLAPDVVVAWLDQNDTQLLDALGRTHTPPSSLYLSSTLMPDTDRLIKHPLASRIRLAHPYLLPTQQSQLKRFEYWARKDGITITAPRLQSDAYFAISLTGEALMHIRGNFSREYFMERIEHMTDNMINTSNYPIISLAPGQRYLVKGVYLWPLQDGPQQARWLVP